VSSISFLIIASATRVDSRAIFFRFTSTSHSTGSSYFKPFSVTFNKRSAGVTSDAGGDSEFLKSFLKLVNPSDRVYIALPCHFSYQRCARRYFTIPDRDFPFYFISNRRIRCIYCANINKKYFTIKFYYLALFRCRADITFINYFLNFQFL
jgi:hypothetical protein